MAFEFRQTIVNEQVMPELCRDDCHQTQFDRGFPCIFDQAIADFFTPILDSRDIEIARFS